MNVAQDGSGNTRTLRVPPPVDVSSGPLPAGRPRGPPANSLVTRPRQDPEEVKPRAVLTVRDQHHQRERDRERQQPQPVAAPVLRPSQVNIINYFN